MAGGSENASSPGRERPGELEGPNPNPYGGVGAAPAAYVNTVLPPGTETFAMRSISHVVVCEVELTLGHGVPGMGFQEH